MFIMCGFGCIHQVFSASLAIVCHLQESKMDPKPDYGYESYKGTGKLTDKVCLAVLRYS